MIQKINAYNILAGKLEGKRLLGRPRCRWRRTGASGSVVG
jgi:hypothetical protein